MHSHSFHESYQAVLLHGSAILILTHLEIGCTCTFPLQELSINGTLPVIVAYLQFFLHINLFHLSFLDGLIVLFNQFHGLMVSIESMI